MTIRPYTTTWLLWHYLCHPAAHPLFERTLKFNRTTSSIAWAALLAGALLCCGISSLVDSSITVLLLIMIVAFSTAYVVTWAMSISDLIIREHERRTYDLLCMSPAGALGVNWAICTGILHRNDVLGWLGVLRKLMAALLLIVLFSILLTTASRQSLPDLSQLFRLSLDIVMLAAASYVDHVQSVVLGSLVGMLVPVYNRTRLDAAVLAGRIFLALQIFTLLAALVILPGSYQGESSPLLLTLLVCYLTREIFIVVLWRALVYPLNAVGLSLTPF